MKLGISLIIWCCLSTFPVILGLYDSLKIVFDVQASLSIIPNKMSISVIYQITLQKYPIQWPRNFSQSLCPNFPLHGYFSHFTSIWWRTQILLLMLHQQPKLFQLSSIWMPTSQAHTTHDQLIDMYHKPLTTASLFTSRSTFLALNSHVNIVQIPKIHISQTAYCGYYLLKHYQPGFSCHCESICIILLCGHYHLQAALY